MRSVALIINLTILAFFSACSNERLPAIPDPTVQVEMTPEPPLEHVDISKLPALSPKGRFQDGQTALGESNQVAKELVANGKNSIPFLISKLDDETEMDRHVMNYWYRLYVGDMALIILGDFFTDETELNSTIPGFGWDEFLERGGDETLMAEEVLRRYIQTHGRKKIRQRWQQMWEQNKERIFWAESCYCFKLRSEK